MVDTLGYLNKNSTKISDIKFTKEQFVSLINMIDSGKLNSKQAKEVLLVMLTDGKDPKKVVKERGMEQISDEGIIASIVDQVLSSNPQVGQVRKLSKGKANPSLAKEKIRAIIGPLGKREAK